MSQGFLQRSFAGGELTPDMWTRADLQRYGHGLALCRNCIVKPQGSVTKRPGLRFLAEVKDSDVSPRLIEWIDEAADQTYLIEAGDSYFRFFFHDAPVLNGFVPYEVATPYAAADVATLQVSQFGNVMTITHRNYAPRELIRFDTLDWELNIISIEPGIAAPTGLVVVKGAVGVLTMRYQVTSVRAGTGEESYPSDLATAAGCKKPTEELPNALTWTPGAGAGSYNVYGNPNGNGIFGLIGRAGPGATFNDVGFQADFGKTPPEVPLNPVPPNTLATLLFMGAGNYPSAVCRHQQRQWFANSDNNRETIWGSQIGVPNNFSGSSPIQDADAIEFIIATDKVTPVRFMRSLNGTLIVLSDAGEWRVLGDERGAITPTSIDPHQDSYFAASPLVRPCLVGNMLVFVQARGWAVRNIRYDQSPNGLVGDDMTVFASHLVRGYLIQDLAFTQEPHSVLWARRDDGLLIGCTFAPDQEILAWHRHVTGGRGDPECVDWDLFESLAVLPNNVEREDVLYTVVARTISGATKRYIERFATSFHPERTPIEDAFFVDSGITYDGAATTVITGLDHLDGMVVAVLADGAVVYDGNGLDGGSTTYRVNGGAITLPAAASVVHVGLPIKFAEVETLDLDPGDGDARGKQKRILSVTAHVYGTADRVRMGPDAAHLRPWRRKTFQRSETWRTGPLEMNVTSAFTSRGRTRIRHTDPLPFTLTGLLPQAAIGG